MFLTEIRGFNYNVLVNTQETLQLLPMKQSSSGQSIRSLLTNFLGTVVLPNTIKRLIFIH